MGLHGGTRARGLFPLALVRSMLIGVLVLAGIVLLLVVQGADTYHWHRTVLKETRREAMRHATWRAGL